MLTKHTSVQVEQALVQLTCDMFGKEVPGALLVLN